MQEIQKRKITLTKEKRIEGLTLCSFKSYSNITTIMAMWLSHKARNVDQWKELKV